MMPHAVYGIHTVFGIEWVWPRVGSRTYIVWVDFAEFFIAQFECLFLPSSLMLSIRFSLVRCWTHSHPWNLTTNCNCVAKILSIFYFASLLVNSARNVFMCQLELMAAANRKSHDKLEFGDFPAAHILASIECESENMSHSKCITLRCK